LETKTQKMIPDYSATVSCPSSETQAHAHETQAHAHDAKLRLTLTMQKEMEISAARAGMSADQLRAVLSAPPAMAEGALLQVPSPVTMSSRDED
jgi:hypothetical protein